MDLKELNKRISKILNTNYHANKMINELIKADKIHKLLRADEQFNVSIKHL